MVRRFTIFGSLLDLYRILYLDGRGQRGNPLEPAPDGGYQVRGSYRFHLYISTAPCGDARIFSPHEETCRPPDRHPNRQ